MGCYDMLSYLMLYCNYYVTLCCVVLCCVVLYCIVLCYVVLCCVTLRCILFCCAVLCCAVLCCAVLCCAVLCCVVLCRFVLCWELNVPCLSVQGRYSMHLEQEPINRSLYLLYYALESALSRVDLFIERLSGEVSHAHNSKTQSKQSKIECIVLRHIPPWDAREIKTIHYLALFWLGLWTVCVRNLPWE